ncbi:MAG: enoyl-CoA hydratase/isomerase family protein [Chloroflexi bacterium]|nr:enoyl-CoA hydratase/isomerase family protein [Chloroflexota bacterium]
MNTVKYEVKDRIAYITMNRPEKLNAINEEMRDELSECFRDVKENPDVWVAIITGAGERAFSTGHDLVQRSERSEGAERPRRSTGSTDDLYVYLHYTWKPTIAAINGYCLAQGGGIALCCDIRVAVEDAYFGWPQVKRGISSVSGPSLLSHKIPLGIALEMLFTGEFVTAQEAARWGMVNKIVKREDLMSTAEEIAQKILAVAPLPVRAIKEGAVSTQGMRLEQRVRIASLLAGGVSQSADSKEGLKAFAEKRAPVWVGR